jgi:mycothiol synthase
MAPGLHVRNFQWTDVEPLTDVFNDINDLVGTEKSFDADFMRQFLSQPDVDPLDHCFVATSDDIVAGFVLMAYEPPIKRAVASGGVLSAYRQLGIGRELLQKAISYAESLEVEVLHVEVSSQGEAAKKMLESEGFHKTKGYWQMQWTGDVSPVPNLGSNFSIRPFRLGEDEEALTLLQNEAFGENWGFSPNTLDQISARVRLDRVTPEGILFITDNGKPAAYNWTMISANSTKATGFISMTGVHPDYRGKGLGRAIVAAGMKYLKAQGVDSIELEVDSDNAPARELYLKLGFTKVHETLWYEKNFEINSA